MKHLPSLTDIKVGLNFDHTVIPVGRLALRDHRMYFEYHASFIEKNIEISPLKLPLKAGLSTFDPFLFEGLPGVFNDSLPDGWGRLLFDRFMRSQGILPNETSPLERLAYTGTHGMGALVYEPDHSFDELKTIINLDVLAEQSQEVLNGSADDIIQELLDLNGSSAGARPKALIGLDRNLENLSHGIHQLPEGHAPWIVKFANTQDGVDAGAVEYVYALMAKNAGISVPDVHLFPSQKGVGYFAIKRFDRKGDQRLHMHTACGLLHSDFRTPSLDYETLISLTGVLTRDVREVEKMFRLAVFNVLAHNRDDHAKNISFLMDEKGTWALSPAYDLTFSSGPRGEQSTMVMGEGRRPTIDHLRKLGMEASMTRERMDEIMHQTKDSLSQWESLAKEHGVHKNTINLIGKKIDP